MLELAAAAAGPAPDRLSRRIADRPGSGAGRNDQAGAADGDDVLVGGRPFDAIAVIAGADSDDYAGVVVRLVVRELATGFAGAVAVAHGVGVLGSVINGGGQVREVVGVGFDQQDVAVGTDGAHHVQVERDLLGPIRTGPGRLGAAGLVHLFEAAAGAGAGRQAEEVAVVGQVVLGLGIV